MTANATAKTITPMTGFGERFDRITAIDDDGNTVVANGLCNEGGKIEVGDRVFIQRTKFRKRESVSIRIAQA